GAHQPESYGVASLPRFTRSSEPGGRAPGATQCPAVSRTVSETSTAPQPRKTPSGVVSPSAATIGCPSPSGTPRLIASACAARRSIHASAAVSANPTNGPRLRVEASTNSTFAGDIAQPLS